MIWENILIAIFFFPQYCDCDLTCDFYFFYPNFFSQQIVMNDLNMTNTILDTFIVKYYFPHFTLQNQEQQIGGFATVHLSNLNKVIVRMNTRHALFKHCVQNVPS